EPLQRCRKDPSRPGLGASPGSGVRAPHERGGLALGLFGEAGHELALRLRRSDPREVRELARHLRTVLARLPREGRTGARELVDAELELRRRLEALPLARGELFLALVETGRPPGDVRELTASLLADVRDVLTGPLPCCVGLAARDPDQEQ